MFPTISNNAHVSKIKSGQLFMEIPMQVVAPDKAALSLDQNTEEMQAHLFQVAFDIGLKMGEAIQTLRLEKLELESENKILKNDITQLKAIHIAQQNEAVDGFIAKRNIIADKVKGIVEKLTLFCRTYPNTSISSSVVYLLKVIAETPVNYEGLRAKHEYIDYRQNRIPLKEETVTAPLSEIFILRQNYPVIRSLTQTPLKDYQALKLEITPLRANKLALIDKKSIMIDYQSRFLAELHRQEREFRLKEILKTVKVVHELIPTFQTSAGMLSALLQPQECTERLKEISMLIQDVISTLEEYLHSP